MGIVFEQQELELIVLSAMLRHKEGVEIVLSAGATEDCFSSPIDRLIFLALSDLYMSSPDGKFNIFDLKSKLTDLTMHPRCDIIRSYSREGTFNTRLFAEALVDRNWVKEAYRASIDFNVLIKTQLENPNRKNVCDSSLEMSTKILAGSENKNTGHSLDATMEIFDKEIEERILAFERKDNLGISSPLTKLNEKIHGFMPNKLYIIAARPGGGKTTLALNCATEACRQNKYVNFFTLEMSKGELADKIISEVGMINYNNLVTGNLSNEEINRIVQARKTAHQWKLEIHDDSKITLEEIQLRCKLNKMKGKLDIVFIDYLTLLDSSRKQESFRLKINYMTREIKKMAKELSVPVIVLAQLNREVEKGTEPRLPKLSDLKESGSIEQDADVVMFIDRTSKEANENKAADLIVAKNRGGETGRTFISARLDVSKFCNGGFN